MMVIIIAVVLALVVVSIHIKALYTLAKFFPSLPISSQLKINLGVISLILAHVIEILIFAIAIFLMCECGDYGALQGDMQSGFSDYIYFSFVNYTTVGFGDYTPVGRIRFVTGVESLVGLVLVTCSASFAFIMMHRFWEEQKSKKGTQKL